MKPAVRVENLSKQYQIGSRAVGRYRTLRETAVVSGDPIGPPDRRESMGYDDGR